MGASQEDTTVTHSARIRILCLFAKVASCNTTLWPAEIHDRAFAVPQALATASAVSVHPMGSRAT